MVQDVGRQFGNGNYGNNIFMQVVLHISILDIPENCLQNNLPIFPKKLPFLEQDLCFIKLATHFLLSPSMFGTLD